MDCFLEKKNRAINLSLKEELLLFSDICFIKKGSMVFTGEHLS